MYDFRTHNKAGLVFAFAFMALFFIIAASMCYIVGYFNPDINDIMKWIAFGILMMGMVMMLTCLIFLVNFLIFMHNKKYQEKINFGKVNKFDDNIFGEGELEQIDTIKIKTEPSEKHKIEDNCPNHNKQL